MNIIKDYIKSPSKRRSGAKLLGVKFLVAHDTGNINTTARQNVNYFKNSPDEMSASAHVFIDDIETIECIPLNEKAWHVWYSVDTDNKKYNADANDYAIGVELCYFTDKNKTQLAYNNYVTYLATLCKEFNLNPLIFISGHFQLDPARKTDPMNAFKIIGKSYDSFLEDVNAKLSTMQSKLVIAPAKIGDKGPNIATIQILLAKGNCVLLPLTNSLYDENMAKSVLYFQLKNNVADIKELSSLRGETIGPKTIKCLTL